MQRKVFQETHVSHAETDRHKTQTDRQTNGWVETKM